MGLNLNSEVTDIRKVTLQGYYVALPNEVKNNEATALERHPRAGMYMHHTQVVILTFSKIIYNNGML